MAECDLSLSVDKNKFFNFNLPASKSFAMYDWWGGYNQNLIINSLVSNMVLIYNSGGAAAAAGRRRRGDSSRHSKTSFVN